MNYKTKRMEMINKAVMIIKVGIDSLKTEKEEKEGSRKGGEVGLFKNRV